MGRRKLQNSEKQLLLKSKMSDSLPPNFRPLNRYTSAADCSISIKVGTEFDHMTPDVL